MKTEKVVVANLKSQGCVNKITWKLLKMSGVSNVSVDPGQSMVLIEHRESLERPAYLHELSLLGYPEAC